MAARRAKSLATLTVLSAVVPGAEHLYAADGRRAVRRYDRRARPGGVRAPAGAPREAQRLMRVAPMLAARGSWAPALSIGVRLTP